MDVSSTIDKLVGFPIFKDLSHHTDALRGLASRMRTQVFQAREFIVDEKKPDDQMYFLTAGEVQISKMDQAGQIVTVGRVSERIHPYFGEGALLGKTVRSANVVAYSQAECMVLSAKDFTSFMEDYPFFAASIYRNIAIVLFDRLAKANRDLMIAGLEG